MYAVRLSPRDKIPVFQRGAAMDIYRLYCMDGAGNIALAEWLNARDDQHAIEQAKELKNGSLKCEIWRGHRLVAKLGTADLQDSRPS